MICLRGSVVLGDRVSTGRVKVTDKAKIGQVKTPLTIKQYVCRLNISVGDTFLSQESQDLQHRLDKGGTIVIDLAVGYAASQVSMIEVHKYLEILTQSPALRTNDGDNVWLAWQVIRDFQQLTG